MVKDDFLLLAKEFTEESEWSLTYDENHASYTYDFYSVDRDCEMIGVYNRDNEVVGGAICALDYLSHKEPFGYLVKFYVRKEYRNGISGTKLIKLCNAWFDKHNVVATFVCPVAKVGAQDVAVKLLTKLGYNQIWSGVRYGKV